MLDVNTRAIKSRTELHWLITRGTIDPGPMLLETLKALQGRIDDLNSRIKDAQYNPARARGTGVVNLTTYSMFAGRKTIIRLRHEGVFRTGRVNVRRVRTRRTGVLLPGYSPGEIELSELRNQLHQLYKERKRLIQDMKHKGTFTGSLPYEALP